jgi:DNA-binding NtrC family response regulator
MEQQFNTRILVIDDDENVRNSFSQILSKGNSGREDAAKLEEAGALLFNDDKPVVHSYMKRSSATFNFEYDEAPNGRQGYEMVKKAIAENRPYAAVFVDMRMPGWDGLETVQQLRTVDTRAEIIFVTAYSDHSIEEIVTAVGTNVSYHCKPFSGEEIEQIATKAVYEWNKTRSLEELIKTISGLRAQHWEMNTLLSNVLHQVAYLLGTHSALLAMKKNEHYEKVLSIGNLCDEKRFEEYLNHIPEKFENEVYQDNDFAYFKVDEFGILAIFEKGGRPLNNERIYIVRLFLEQAAQAIRNVDLQEALIGRKNSPP